MFSTEIEWRHEEYAVQLQSIPEEDFTKMNLSELQAIANRLKVQSFDDKQEQIKAILWGRKFYAPKPKPEPQKENPDSFWIHMATEKIESRMSLKSLKLLCLEKGIAPTEGDRRHKETWIHALFAAGVLRYK